MSGYIIERELIVPSGETVNGAVDLNWNVYFGGAKQKRYSDVAALALTTLFRNMNEPMTPADTAVCMRDLYNLARDMFPRLSPNSFEDVGDFKSTVSVADLALNELKKDDRRSIRGDIKCPFLPNLIYMGYEDIDWYMLCSDMTDESVGLEGITNGKFTGSEGFYPLIRPSTFRMKFELAKIQAKKESNKQEAGSEPEEASKIWWPAKRKGAACAKKDPKIFKPSRGEDSSRAKKVCAGCPIKPSCLEEALEVSEKRAPGIRGGTSARERRILRRQARDVSRHAE